MDADGSSHLIHPAITDVCAPSWSPDGRRILFTRGGGGTFAPNTVLV
jgi:Tol biopolymer transport system component